MMKISWWICLQKHLWMVQIVSLFDRRFLWAQLSSKYNLQQVSHRKLLLSVFIIDRRSIHLKIKVYDEWLSYLKKIVLHCVRAYVRAASIIRTDWAFFNDTVKMTDNYTKNDYLQHWPLKSCRRWKDDKEWFCCKNRMWRLRWQQTVDVVRTASGVINMTTWTVCSSTIARTREHLMLFKYLLLERCKTGCLASLDLTNSVCDGHNLQKRIPRRCHVHFGAQESRPFAHPWC